MATLDQTQSTIYRAYLRAYTLARVGKEPGTVGTAEEEVAAAYGASDAMASVQPRTSFQLLAMVNHAVDPAKPGIPIP